MDNDNTSGMDRLEVRRQLKKQEREERKAKFKEVAYDIHNKETQDIFVRFRKDADNAVIEYKALGRPRKINQDIIDEILERMTNGQNLKDICRMSHMPAPVTIYQELERNPHFSNLFTRARQLMADTLFDECLSIADDDKDDMIYNKVTKETIVNHAKITRDKLKIDTRLRVAGRLNPRKYSEKLLAGAENVTVNHNNLTINARDMTPNDRDKLRQLLLNVKQERSNVIDE